MRWFVEISPLGASEGQKQSWCLEASGWQPALKDARSIRGEDGPLGGFSIELLDDGARAVDPVTRIRYVIRSAPDDTVLTHVKDGAGKPSAVKADPANEPAKSEPAKSEPAKSEPAKSEPARADLAKIEPTKSDLVKVEPAKSDLVKVEPVKSDLVKVEPVKSDLVKVEAPSDDVEIPVDEEGSSDDTAPLPTYQLLQAREEDPNERSPLTYREYVYAVDAGTPDAEIERVLHARFAAVKEALATATQGRFVNLAIFDHVFTGKPKKRPRATLTWKDWRGAPEIHFPSAERTSLEPPSFTAPTSFSKAIPQPSIPPAEPLSAVPSTAVAPTEPAPAKLVAKAAEPAPAPEPTPAPIVPSAAPIVSIPAPIVSNAPPTPAAITAPSPTAPLPAEPLPIKIEAPAKVTIEAAPAVSVTQPAPPVSAAPKTMPAAAQQPAPPAPARREAYIPPVKTAAQAGKRMAGDELISELFEACGDLQFLRDSLEGADFVLSLALEKLPSELGLVSLFDINRREFVVVRQAGGPRSIVLARLPERSGLAQAAMRKTSAIVVPDASKEPRVLDDRIRALGIQLTSVMVAPVEVSGRYLGLIELVNPADGRAFTEGDGHALTYIGEQYAEFVAERGVVLDPESVIERHQKR